jgi:hypothetical protein
VSLETKDVMTAICNFLSRRCNFTGAVDNKHNVKKDRYQIVSRSGFPLVGKYVANVDLIQQASVPEDLWIVKDFADDDADTDKSNMKNDEDDGGGVDAVLPIDAESTDATSRNNKLDSALDTSKKL